MISSVDVFDGQHVDVSFPIPLSASGGENMILQINDTIHGWLSPISELLTSPNTLSIEYTPSATITPGMPWRLLIQPTGFTPAGTFQIPQTGFTI